MIKGVVRSELARKPAASCGFTAIGCRRGVGGKIFKIFAVKNDVLVGVWTFHFVYKAKNVPELVSCRILKAPSLASSALLSEVDYEVGTA
jgi:hypothetical protein